MLSLMETKVISYTANSQVIKLSVSGLVLAELFIVRMNLAGGVCVVDALIKNLLIFNIVNALTAAKATATAAARVTRVTTTMSN